MKRLERECREHFVGPGRGASGWAVAAGAALFGSWVWASAQLAWLASTGHWVPQGGRGVLAVLADLPHHLADPALAWLAARPAGPLPETPGPVAFYGMQAALLVLFLIAGALLGRSGVARRGGAGRRAALSGREHAARWAAISDTRVLRPGRREAGRRLVLGRTGTLVHRLVATEASHSVLVIGPTQSGKTSGVAIPALLEWQGAVVATSVKDDLARATIAWRSRVGPVWVFDPTASSGLQPLSKWTPLASCPGWSGAQRTASWLVDATPSRAGMADAAFWYAAAAKQLAPLLLAAATAGLSMGDLVRWTNSCDFEEPLCLLQRAGATEAALALEACERRDERIRSSVATTLETVLAPFEDPTVARWTSGSEIDLDMLLGSGGSLYLCGPSHEQTRVQGVFASLVSSLLVAAAERAAGTGRPLDPPLLVVLDEAANIAPVRDLDMLASTCAGLGVQLVTVCQDLGQLAGRYGPDRSRTIVNNHRAKLLLSGVSDLATLDLLSGLAGEEAVREESLTFDQRDGRRTRTQAVAFRRLAPPDRLRRIQPGRGVLLYGHLPPLELSLRPWFAEAELARRGRSGSARGRSQPAGGLRARLDATRGGSPGILE